MLRRFSDRALEIIVSRKESKCNMSDLISKSALLEEMKKFCGKQTYLILQEIWDMVQNFPQYESDENKEETGNE